ncbi:TCR/Tet family MFS transporter [Dyella caseinilytica]|uniref:TCR/Tet family MFS transporter n=1 Tax=Dyella caseinilytica TaxID=1849581 RepID=A0ABX7GUX8_9GAMM|nr:TCR/Tet family MFS transporter [Dyella caseinilytica]QRN54104.1 TCR/Tet family MFS transporter [Dyella caseinilytica]GFZ91580.1 tetracycline resistance MFS efflux pump [Dyella caseinilytica]
MDSALPPASSHNKAAFAFIFVTVMLDMLAFGIIIPVLPHLIVDLIGGSIAKAAVWTSAFGTVYMLMQFVFSPVQGTLSDRFGRRTVILISSFGLGMDFIVMALTPTLWLLFVGRVISGICAASFSTANAYIADIVPKEKRAAAFGMMGAAFAVGFIVGPALGGFLGHFSIRLPFWVAAVLSLINFCYGFFVLPESLPPERRTKRFDWRHANPFGALVLLRRYPQVFTLAAVFFLINLAQFSLNSTYVLYTDYRYGWGPQTVGYTLGLVGLCSGLVQAILVRQLMPKLGERRMIMVGLPLCVVGYLFFGLSSVAWVFLLGIPFLCLGGLAGPPAQAMMTQQVDPHEQGRLQGALTSLASLAGVFGPAVFANLFALFISDHAPMHLPGIAFVLAAVLLTGATVLAHYAIQHFHAVPAAQPAENAAARLGSELSPVADIIAHEPVTNDQPESPR